MGGVTDLKYEFTLIKNIHMYNHLLICTDGEKEYRAICESAPEREPTVIFWPDDLGIPPGGEGDPGERPEGMGVLAGLPLLFSDSREDVCDK